MKAQLSKAMNYWPQWDWQSVCKHISERLSEQDLASATVGQLTGGRSIDGLFIINVSGRDNVLRMMSVERKAEQCREIIETSCWAGENGLGPKIVLVEKGFRFFIMERLSGENMRLYDFQSPERIQLLGKLLVKIHQTTPPKHPRVGSFFTIGQNWYQTISQQSHPLLEILAEAFLKWQKLRDTIEDPVTTKVMVHSDVGPRNIFCQGEILLLIDWEFAGLADPRREVARTCAWYGYDSEQTILLLTSYYGRNPTPQELAVNEKLRMMLHLELSWFLFSRLDLSELDQEAWQQLYQDTTAQSLHDYAITHDNEELDHNDVNLQTEALTKLKYFLQQDLV